MGGSNRREEGEGEAVMVRRGRDWAGGGSAGRRTAPGTAGEGLGKLKADDAVSGCRFWGLESCKKQGGS